MILSIVPQCGNPIGSAQDKGSSFKNSSNCSVVLVSVGIARLQVVKSLTEILGIGIKEAKEFVDEAPCSIADGLTLYRAQEIAQHLVNQNGDAEIKIMQNGRYIKTYAPSNNSTLNGSPIPKQLKGGNYLSWWYWVLITLLALITFFYFKQCA